MRKQLCIIFVIFFATGGCVATSAAPSGDDPGASWTHGGMVAVANPYAAQTAAAVLRQGGHAVDAAIAAHAVLGLVEPQSSGLGGGAFMLVYDRQQAEVFAYDGRETAPAGATADLFLEHGEQINFLDAWQGGIAVGTPGVAALYDRVHADHGRLDMAINLADAIDLASVGFTVSPRLAGFLARMTGVSRLDDNPASAAYFYPEGEPLAAGSVRTNPDYARTLERFVKEGPSSFYSGELAEAMVAAVAAEPNPGTLSLADLAGYRVNVEQALCENTGVERICTMPPPSSGLSQIMIVNLYDHLARDSINMDLPALVDAQRLAYADRDHYVADRRFVDVPVRQLLDPDYLTFRAGQRFGPSDTPTPGDPGAVLDDQPLIDLWGRDTTHATPGTSHLSIVDTYGNAVSMTATVEAPFGSSRWAGGFLLNNQMTDFARTPTLGGKAVANIIEPGKRPRSSMSPVIVFDSEGELKMITGSPGGNSIIAYVAKTLIGVLRAGMTAQQAVDSPNVVARGPSVRVEIGVPGGKEQALLLTDLGYPVQQRQGENSGLHVIVVRKDGLEGAADPRREGIVIGVSEQTN